MIFDALEIFLTAYLCDDKSLVRMLLSFSLLVLFLDIVLVTPLPENEI